jgi:hypothetical protein
VATNTADWLGKSRRYLVIALFLALPICWITSRVVAESFLEAGFDKVSLGMSENEVIALMGRPDEVNHCTGLLARREDPNCALGYLYYSAWGRFLPWYPAIWFGSDRTVTHKYAFVSP